MSSCSILEYFLYFVLIGSTTIRIMPPNNTKTYHPVFSPEYGFFIVINLLIK